MRIYLNGYTKSESTLLSEIFYTDFVILFDLSVEKLVWNILIKAFWYTKLIYDDFWTFFIISVKNCILSKGSKKLYFMALKWACILTS